MAEAFGDQLAERIRSRGPLCVGIDPSKEQLVAWDRGDDITGLEYFMLQMLESCVDVAVAVKPQVAYFERFGSRGIAALERLIAEARAGGVVVIGDAKRGDIGSTNDGYAEAWLHDSSPLAVDALTVTPYLGIHALESIFRAADATGRGVFVVVASSNDEGRVVQTAQTSTGESVEDWHFRQIAERNERGAGRLGSIGAVVGATRTPPRFPLEEMRGTFLVPGVGAQGATPNDVGRMFAKCPKGSVLVNASRAVSSAGPERRAVNEAARRLRDDLTEALL
jgi:orotidine-5'-phosphate decarboxylase